MIVINRKKPKISATARRIFIIFIASTLIYSWSQSTIDCLMMLGRGGPWFACGDQRWVAIASYSFWVLVLVGGLISEYEYLKKKQSDQ